MDKRLALKMLDFIERLNAENLALRAVLDTATRNWSKHQTDSFLERAMNDPVVRESIHEQWMPVRNRLESDASLEEAFQQFLQITPPPTDVN